MSEEILCSYFGCDEPIADDENQYTGDTMKFCETHRDEINKLVEDQDPKGILRFWVKAQGGAKRAAKRTLGIEVDDE